MNDLSDVEAAPPSRVDRAVTLQPIPRESRLNHADRRKEKAVVIPHSGLDDSCLRGLVATRTKKDPRGFPRGF